MNSIIQKISALKEKCNALILAHNYQLPETQDIADYLGDSLGLSQIAAGTDADVILFCGVHFMAETASILSPEKTILIPDLDAGCPMADMLDADGLRKLKGEHPDAVVVTYINSTAEVKAETDICCTSANATKVVASIDPDREIIFGPDKYLGRYAADQTGRKLILWNGFCPTHARILPEHIIERKKQYPDAEVMVHPECRLEVIKLADAALSTSGMCNYPANSKARKFIVGTEVGLTHQLKKRYPDFEFINALDEAVCPNMKLHTLEKILWSLEEMNYEVKVSESVRLKAKKAVDAMINIGRGEVLNQSGK